MLTNRELATIILVLTGLVVFFLVNKTTFLAAFRDLFATLAKMKVIAITISYLGYSIFVYAIAFYFNLWDVSFVKTVILSVILGFSLVLDAVGYSSGKEILLKYVKKKLAFTAFIIAYMNLASFNLITEMLFQIFIFTMLAFITGLKMPQFKDQYRTFRIVLEVLAFIISGIYVLHTTLFIINGQINKPFSDIVQSFLISLIFPLVLIPFLYIFALYSNIEHYLAISNYYNTSNKKKSKKTILTLLVGSRFRLSNIYGITKDAKWKFKLGEANSMKEELKVLGDYRQK